MANKLKLDTIPLLGMKRKKAVRRRKLGPYGSRCSHCNGEVEFKTHKALSAFLNQGRVCDMCVTRNLSVAAGRVDPYEYASRLATLNID